MRTTLFSASLLSTLALIAPPATPAPAPEFTHTDASSWINSGPRTLGDLRGEVVLVEFWTYGCSNCLATLPWLKAVHGRHADKGLVVVGVHSPEFPHERDADRVRAAVKKHGIGYAVMIDNDFSYWNALGNRYWPAFYLIDRTGSIAAREFGELHAGQARGDEFERKIVRLLEAD